MVRAGKLRRSRPILPSASESSRPEESSAANTVELPAGCTILDRNPHSPPPGGGVKSVGTQAQPGPAADTTGNADVRWPREASVGALPSAVKQDKGLMENVVDGVGGTKTSTSSVSDQTAAAFSQASSTAPSQRLSDAPGSAQTRDDRPPPSVPDSKSKSKASPLKEAWASAGALLESVASAGGMRKTDDSRGVKGRRESTVVAHAGEKGVAAPAAGGSARTREKLEPGRQQQRAEQNRNAPPIALLLRYNPGPTFRKSRGRKRKVLLDPSEITANDVIGVEKLLALLKDPAIQQVSLIQEPSSLFRRGSVGTRSEDKISTKYLFRA